MPIMNNQAPTAVLLLNLGGPSTLDEVEPFLLNLFSDRMIIRLGPFFMQRIIARRIARKRAPSSRVNYEKIGGGSPILRITNNQAEALEKSLNQEGDFIVRPCMRYWHPYAEEVLSELKLKGVEKCVALPLYPHYSIATTGSSLSDLQNTQAKLIPAMKLLKIRSWPIRREYIDCLIKRIQQGLKHFGNQPVELVYSAHSLPQDFIDQGDPYIKETKETIAALTTATGINGHLCFQSRSGPVKWVGPSTPQMLKQLADQGCRNILMVPISFVSDHLETLYEIDILYHNMAKELGMQLKSTPGLNDDQLFIKGLKGLVLDRLQE